MFFLKLRQYFAYIVDKYLLRGALVRIVNGHLDVDRRPYIDLLIRLPKGTKEYDPTEIVQMFLHDFNYGPEALDYGGGFSPKPFDVFFDITPTVRMVSKQKKSCCPRNLS